MSFDQLMQLSMKNFYIDNYLNMCLNTCSKSVRSAYIGQVIKDSFVIELISSATRDFIIFSSPTKSDSGDFNWWAFITMDKHICKQEPRKAYKSDVWERFQSRIIYSSNVAHYAIQDVIWLTDLKESGRDAMKKEERKEERKRSRSEEGEMRIDNQ